MKQQRSTLEKRNALEERKSGDAVGRPSRRSSLLGDPGEKFLGGKLKSSLNSVSTCLKVVDTRRLSEHFEEKEETVVIRRKPTYAEAAKAIRSANAVLYQVLLPIDVRLGGKNSAELHRMFEAWVAAK